MKEVVSPIRTDELKGFVPDVAQLYSDALLLYRALGRRLSVIRCQKLIMEIGSLPEVFDRPVEELTRTNAISRKVADQIAAFRELAETMTRVRLKGRDVLSHWDQLEKYLNTCISHVRDEQVLAIYLTARNQIIYEKTFPGHPGGVLFELHQVVAPAIQIGATGIILVHNHPSGYTDPSPLDIKQTEKIAKMASDFGITILDHLIVSRGQPPFSFRRKGLAL